MFRRVATVALALLALACSSSPIATSRSNDEAAVRATMTRFLDALNALDLETMAALFADDVTAFVPSARPDRIDGKAAVTAIFRAFVDRAKQAAPSIAPPIVAEDLRVEVAGELAVVSFVAHRPTSTNRRTFVLRKSAVGWRIAHFHASDLPG